VAPKSFVSRIAAVAFAVLPRLLYSGDATAHSGGVGSAAGLFRLLRIRSWLFTPCEAYDVEITDYH
jgi:hypothetical protein